MVEMGGGGGHFETYQKHSLYNNNSRMNTNKMAEYKCLIC